MSTKELYQLIKDEKIELDGDMGAGFSSVLAKASVRHCREKASISLLLL